MIAQSHAAMPPPSALDRHRALAELERRHPELWRAGQLGRAATLPVWPTGHDALSAQLPGGGWPTGAVTELLHADNGVGELRLLQPALHSLTEAGRRLALIGPPHAPNAPALKAWGLPPRLVYWIRAGEDAGAPRRAVAKGGRMAGKAAQQADLLWAAEQVLRSGAFGGVLVWLPAARPEAVRRLQVLAQASEAVVWVCRPATALRESSPAVLRLLLSPLPGNALSIVFHKRRGPVRDIPLILPLGAMPAVPAGRDAGPQPLSVPASANESVNESDHAVLDRGTSAAPAAGRAAPELA